MEFVIKNWKSIGAALFAAIITAYASHVYKEYALAKQAKAHGEAMAAQETALKNKCEADKAITEKVSHDYQTKVSSLNRQLADARRMFDNACVPVSVAADTAAGRDGSTLGTKPAGQNDYGNSIRASRLLDLAAEGEQYRIQLIACQSFVKSTWSSRK